MPITLNNAGRAKLSKKSRLRESAQGDKRSFCLTAGKIGPRIRREHEQETAPEPCIGIAERKAMIDRDHDLPLRRQAAVLNISRGSLYYKPRPVSAADLALMRRMDELHLEFPFAGARMLQGLLAAEGSKVGRRHVRTLMRRMGMETVYRRPNTSKPAPGHRIYPY